MSADDTPGGGPDGPVAVISYALWQRRFGGSPTTVGAPLVVDGVPVTIVGVMPPAFFGAEVGRAVDIALPMQTEPLIRGKDSRIGPELGFYGLTVVLRLKPDQTIDTATTLLRGIQPQIRAAAMPTTMLPLIQQEFMKDAFTVVPAATGTSRLRAQYIQPLVALFVVAGLVLVIACANIANLQFARATARRQELSMRLALGAPRWRVVRLWFVESILLAGVGATLGFVLAAWGSRALVAQLSSAANRVYLDLSLDWRVLAFTATVAIGTAVVFGTLPALRASHVAPSEALQAHGRGTSNAARLRLSNGLIIVQVAFSLIIVVAAGLFVRTFNNLAGRPLGFDPDRVLLVNANVARTRLPVRDRLSFFDRLAVEAGGVPGVGQAAASLMTPVVGGGIIDVVRVPGAAPSLDGIRNGKLTDHSTFVNAITPGWFATYGMALTSGRDFDQRDSLASPPVIIVNETFVRKFLGGRTPVGATVALERGRAEAAIKTIIGVVGDAVYGSIRDDAEPIEYAPLAQFDIGPVPSAVTLSLRSSAGSPALLARPVAAALRAVDPDLTLTFRPLTEQVGASLIQERLLAQLAGFFGALALLLAGLGLYGVTSYAVNRRRTEIGIRMALGAAPHQIVQLVLRRVSVLVGLGLLCGMGASVWAASFVATLLYGLEPRDPMTLSSAAAVLAGVGALAASVPASRASRTDPANVLREA